MGLALDGLGNILRALGDPAGSRKALDEGLEVFRRAGMRRHEATLAVSCAMLANQEAGAEEAERQWMTAIELNRGAGGEVEWLAKSLSSLGRLLRENGRGEEARPHLHDALQLARERGFAAVVVGVLCDLALLGDEVPTKELQAASQETEDFADTQGLLLLWRVTGEFAHLERAYRETQHLAEHAPPEYRKTMIGNVPFHREIVEAWETHGNGGK